MKLTIQQLEEWGACNLDACRPFVGDGITVTEETILAAAEAGLLDANWLAEKILTDSALAEHDRVTAPALAEYRRVTAEAWTEYRRATALALAKIVEQPAAMAAVRGTR